MAGTQEPGSDKNAGNPGKPGRAPRKERGQANNGFWYLLVIGVLAAVFFSVAARGRSGEKVEYSDFVSRVKSKTLNKDEVFELSIGTTMMVWQDQPQESLRSGKATSVKRFYASWPPLTN